MLFRKAVELDGGISP